MKKVRILNVYFHHVLRKGKHADVLYLAILIMHTLNKQYNIRISFFNKIPFVINYVIFFDGV